MTLSADDQRKMEILRGMDPQKLHDLRRASIPVLPVNLADDQRVQEMQAAGATKENNAEFNKLIMILEFWSKARMIE